METWQKTKTYILSIRRLDGMGILDFVVEMKGIDKSKLDWGIRGILDTSQEIEFTESEAKLLGIIN